MKKIGILGGSFNPPHLDHLNIAIFIKNSQKLDEVWFLPSYNPLKDPSKYVSPEHRLEMLRIAISKAEQNEGLKICEKDIQRNQPSYMIDTLRELRLENPDTEFELIIGSDSLLTLNQWKDWRSLVNEFKVIVVPRPDYVDIPKGWEEIENIKYLSFLTTQGFSSTDLRRWARLIQIGLTIEDKVKAFPKGVLEYIIMNKLYKEDDNKKKEV